MVSIFKCCPVLQSAFFSDEEMEAWRDTITYPSLLSDKSRVGHWMPVSCSVPLLNIALLTLSAVYRQKEGMKEKWET